MEIYSFTTQCIFRVQSAFFAIISVSRKRSYALFPRHARFKLTDYGSVHGIILNDCLAY